MEGNLYLDLRINEEGNISILDNSLYERWFLDYVSADEFENAYKEVLNKKVTFECVGKIEPDFSPKFIMSDNGIMGTIDDLHAIHTINLNEDGVYCYQRVIIPTELEDNCPFYYDTRCGKIFTDEGDEVTMWDVIDLAKRGGLNLLYWEKHFVDTYDIEECYLALERERIGAALNNCNRFDCAKNPSLSVRADILLAILILIEELKSREGGLDEIAELISKVRTCNGLCPEAKTKLKGCGCGSNN